MFRIYSSVVDVIELVSSLVVGMYSQAQALYIEVHLHRRGAVEVS
jgi:hypothetical protein